jgi:histidyl-tRNA synthetase
MLLSLRKAQLIPNVPQCPTVFIAAVNDSVKREAIKLASRLRDANISCDIDFKNRNLRRQLEYAETIGTPYTLIIGPSELSKGKIKLRNMQKHSEEEIPIESITKYLRKK